MALTAKLKKAVEQGLITQKQAELLAAETVKTKGKKADHSAPGFFTRVVQVLGGALALGGLSVFTFWASDNFSSWGYVLLMLGYACISFAAFDWMRHKHQNLPTAILGTIFTSVICGFLFSLFTTAGWLVPYSTEPQWFAAHTILSFGLIAAIVVSARFTHWLTDLTLALLWVGFFYTLVAHGASFFTPGEGVYAATLLITGLATTAIAYVWRRMFHQSRSTRAFHILAALYIYFGLISLEPGLAFVPQSLPYLTLYAIMIAMGVLIERRAYTVMGVIGIIAFFADNLWHWFNNPLFFSFITIGVGLFMVYGVTRAQMMLPSRLVKKLALPHWLTHN